MSRKAVIGIVAAALALAFVAAVVLTVGVVHATTAAVVTQTRPGVFPGTPGRQGIIVGPLGQQVVRTAVVRVGGGAARGLVLALALLIAGGVGALIVYLAGESRPRAAVPAAVPPSLPAAAGPHDAEYRQFLEWQQWQQFERWHRQAHGDAGAGASALSTQPPDELSTAPAEPESGAPATPPEQAGPSAGEQPL